MRKTITALVAASALVLAGCGGSSALDDVEVTGDDTPTVEAENISVDETVTRVIDAGDGDEIGADDTISVRYLVINGRTGEEIDNSFSTDFEQTITLGSDTLLPGFQKGLEGQQVGSRVLVGVAPEDGTQKLADPSQLGLEDDDTMIFLFDIIAKIPQELEGGTEQDAPESMPELQLEGGKPTGFTTTEATPAELTESAKHVVIEGDGDELADDSTMTVLYLGQNWPDGEVFNNAYPTGPVPGFTLGNMIPCWNDLLPGTKVGSRVVLECAEKDAYADPQAGQPEGPLIFVVDILAAS